MVWCMTTKRPDEHVLAVEEEKLSPVVLVVTIVLIILFVLALLYRLGLMVL